MLGDAIASKKYKIWKKNINVTNTRARTLINLKKRKCEKWKCEIWKWKISWEWEMWRSGGRIPPDGRCRFSTKLNKFSQMWRLSGKRGKFLLGVENLEKYSQNSRRVGDYSGNSFLHLLSIMFYKLNISFCFIRSHDNLSKGGRLRCSVMSSLIRLITSLSLSLSWYPHHGTIKEGQALLDVKCN